MHPAEGSSQKRESADCDGCSEGRPCYILLVLVVYVNLDLSSM